MRTISRGGWSEDFDRVGTSLLVARGTTALVTTTPNGAMHHADQMTELHADTAAVKKNALENNTGHAVVLVQFGFEKSAAWILEEKVAAKTTLSRLRFASAPSDSVATDKPDGQATTARPDRAGRLQHDGRGRGPRSAPAATRENGLRRLLSLTIEGISKPKRKASKPSKRCTRSRPLGSAYGSPLCGSASRPTLGLGSQSSTIKKASKPSKPSKVHIRYFWDCERIRV